MENNDEIINTGYLDDICRAPAGIGLGVAAGLGTDAAIDDSTPKPEDFGGEDGQINTIWELISFAIANFFNHLVTLGVILGVFWLLSIYLGMRKKRPEEKAAEQQVKMLVDKIGQMKEK